MTDSDYCCGCGDPGPLSQCPACPGGWLLCARCTADHGYHHRACVAGDRDRHQDEARANRALDAARIVARDRYNGGGSLPDALRSAADWLLRRAADLDSVKPAACPACGETDLVRRVAWVDARTREYFGPKNADDLIDEDYYCAACSALWEDGPVP